MSEQVQSAAVSMLANESPVRLSNILKNPNLVAQQLRQEWLPKGWSPENESETTETLTPDSRESNEAAEMESTNLDKAGATWASLTPPQRNNLLEAVKKLTPGSEAETDLLRTLEQNQPQEVSELS